MSKRPRSPSTADAENPNPRKEARLTDFIQAWSDARRIDPLVAAQFVAGCVQVIKKSMEAESPPEPVAPGPAEAEVEVEVEVVAPAPAPASAEAEAEEAPAPMDVAEEALIAPDAAEEEE